MTRRGRWMLAIVASVVLGSFAYLVFRTPSEQPFHDYVAAMRAAGEPTTFEEFVGPMPPDEENAAPEIEAALRAVEDEFGTSNWPTGSAWNLSPPGSTWSLTQPKLYVKKMSDDDRAEVRRFADALQPFADRVAKALDRPRFRFPVVLDSEGARSLPEVDRMRSAILLIDQRAGWASDPGARLEALCTLARLAARWETDSTWDTRVAMAALRECWLWLEIGDRHWDAVTVRERMDAVLAERWLPRITRVNRYGRVGALSEYRALLAGVPSERERLGLPVYAWKRVHEFEQRLRGRRVDLDFERGNAILAVDVMEFNRAASSLPTDSFVRFRDRHGELARAAGLAGTRVPLLNFSDDLAAWDAHSRLARVGLALAAQRATQGGCPPTLDALRSAFPGGIPVDPYADAPFLYERNADGARVWSRARLAPLPAATFEEARKRDLAWEIRE